MRARMDDDDLVADEEIVISTPARIEFHQLHRHAMETNASRNLGADGNREIDLGHRTHILLLDGGADVVRCSVDSFAEPAAAPWPVVVRAWRRSWFRPRSWHRQVSPKPCYRKTWHRQPSPSSWSRSSHRLWPCRRLSCQSWSCRCARRQGLLCLKPWASASCRPCCCLVRPSRPSCRRPDPISCRHPASCLWTAPSRERFFRRAHFAVAGGTGDGTCARTALAPTINAPAATDISNRFLVCVIEILRLSIDRILITSPTVAEAQRFRGNLRRPSA